MPSFSVEEIKGNNFCSCEDLQVVDGRIWNLVEGDGIQMAQGPGK